MKPSLVTRFVVCSGGVLLMGSSPVPTPPQAPRRDHVHAYHGKSFADPYFWLREKGTPQVEKYLEAENAYLEATSGDVKPFSEALYA
jgi:oligopeptidase B